MALRYVFHRARPFGQLKGGKLWFLGAVNGGGANPFIDLNNNNNDSKNPLRSSNCLWRRHYFLPPPPAIKFLNFPTIAGVHAVDDAETDDNAIRAAEFAVKTHSQEAPQDEIDGAGEIRFVRVLRASIRRVAGLMYYLTLEGLRGKADMNVYYAEVLDCPSENLMKLIKWELVTESFSYPFENIRSNDFLEKKHRRERAAAKNFLVGVLLAEMDVRCRNAEAAKLISSEGNLDSTDPIAKNSGSGMLNVYACPPAFPENLLDFCPTVIHKIDPFFDIKTYEMVSEYAMFAIETQYKNREEKVHLKDVLWASKCKVNDGCVYRIILEATDGENNVNFYYAIVKVCSMRCLELIKWHLMDEAINPSEKIEIPEELKSWSQPWNPPPDDKVQEISKSYA